VRRVLHAARRNARLSLEWTHLATGDDPGYGYEVNQAQISMAWRF
jgi:hypothetical protein